MFDMLKGEFNEKVILPIERYTELVKEETQFEFVKKWLKDKTANSNYADVSDLLILLDVKEGETNE